MPGRCGLRGDRVPGRQQQAQGRNAGPPEQLPEPLQAARLRRRQDRGRLGDSDGLQEEDGGGEGLRRGRAFVPPLRAAGRAHVPRVRRAPDPQRARPPRRGQDHRGHAASQARSGWPQGLEGRHHLGLGPRHGAGHHGGALHGEGLARGRGAEEGRAEGLLRAGPPEAHAAGPDLGQVPAAHVLQLPRHPRLDGDVHAVPHTRRAEHERSRGRRGELRRRDAQGRQRPRRPRLQGRRAPDAGDHAVRAGGNEDRRGGASTRARAQVRPAGDLGVAEPGLHAVRRRRRGRRRALRDPHRWRAHRPHARVQGRLHQRFLAETRRADHRRLLRAAPGAAARAGRRHPDARAAGALLLHGDLGPDLEGAPRELGGRDHRRPGLQVYGPRRRRQAVEAGHQEVHREHRGARDLHRAGHHRRSDVQRDQPVREEVVLRQRGRGDQPGNPGGGRQALVNL
mmetsp:Transcript_15428/g.46283  ORF Transcript_15428/g.46283 Transcript_15428/m.46283 type:complete len:453 (-) Transcript_15428:305-1663(-)